MLLHVTNETGRLKSVVLGQPKSMGKNPTLEQTYDAKSRESVLKKIYPTEEAISKEMTGFDDVLKKYDVHVFRPWVIPNCNQVFARDVGFVIDDKIIISNIFPDREDEQEAYDFIFKSAAFNKIFNLPESAHIEGGDVVLYNDFLFVGTYKGGDYGKYKTARTNSHGVNFLRELFPHKKVLDFSLVKNDENPHKGVLHLDCAFQPIGNNKAIIYKEGFRGLEDYETVLEIFGKDNIFHVTEEEMYHMTPNIFSISPNIVVTEQNFTRLNNFLEKEWGFIVEKIPYNEISKMGGLLRCSTLPLFRE
ncbi:MAG: arginine deiminase family protein [bacterium]